MMLQQLGLLVALMVLSVPLVYADNGAVPVARQWIPAHQDGG